jgi:hypothetical protein
MNLKKPQKRVAEATGVSERCVAGIVKEVKTISSCVST